ncbi:hypothetical protein NQ315_003668 [Exocentrus adspersus]|uniref:Uncharacterized protein n=1 Tax=Exocentrus adspersus TaxID=1586481 RepID=A0AAV8V9P7_9CUCU|nr:hypothetical protein NQ315_003668 [Exocentrus adspersus]
MRGNVGDKHWDENITNLQLGLNSTVNKAIGVCPSKALMEFRVTNTRVLEAGGEQPLDVTALREEMQKLVTNHQAEQKRRFDLKRTTGRKYEEGDLVLLRLTTNFKYGDEQETVAEMERSVQSYPSVADVTRLRVRTLSSGKAVSELLIREYDLTSTKPPDPGLGT